MKNGKLFLSLILIGCSCAEGESIITLFFEPLPRIEEPALEKLLKRKTVIDTVSRTMIEKATRVKLPVHIGIPALYAGYWTVSSDTGQITFPRKQTETALHLLITDAIDPVIYHGQTVNHLQLFDPGAARFYKLERTQDENTGRYFWQVSSAELPKTLIVPLPTIIIFANPETITVPLGMTPTVESSHFFLPTLFVKERSDVSYVLKLLEVNPYFERVTKFYRESNDRYATLLQH